MGKGGSAKVEVTYYYMSIYFGICIAVDKLLAIIIKEKTAWQGEIEDLTDINIQLRDLFGGDKKEGGAIGNVTYLPGDDAQVMPDHLATRMGRANGADCVAYRGVSSLFFHRDNTSSSRGFYWGANNPYLPGVWAKVQRAPKGLDPAYALVGAGTPAGATVWSDPLPYADTATMLTYWVETPATNYTWALATHPVNGTPALKVSAPSGTTGTLNTRLTYTISGLIPGETYVFHRDLYVAGYSTLSAGWHYDFSPQTLVADSEGKVYPYVYASQTGTVPSNVVYYYDNLYLERVAAGDGTDANPAHIIYECLTNTDWGMGTPAAAVDYDAFDTASQTLYAEGFGLSLLWTRQAAITDFVQEILDHIQAVLYVEPSTGLLTLSLIRDDYDPDELEEITPDNADLTSFQRKLWGEIVNEIVVTWTNPDNEQEETVSAQDLASIAMQGGVVSDSRNYYGVRNADLAQSLAWRDLRSAGQPLASCTAEVDRAMWASRPGRCVKLTWPEYGLSELVMRIVNVEYGQPGDATIKLELIEDVYGLDIGTYEAPPATEWVDPSADPEPLELVDIVTMPLFLAADSTVAAFVDSPEYPEVVVGILVSTAASDAYEYQLWDEVTLTNGDLEWQQLTANNIIGHATLTDALDAEATTTGVSFSGLVGSTAPTVAGFVFIGDDGEAGNEIALIDADDGTFTLVRGVLDTIPRAWPAGTPVWFVDGSTVWEDPIVRAAGETVDYKLLPRTSQGVLNIDFAPLESETLTERPWLPNRPANVTAAGEAWTDPTLPFDVTARADPWVTVTWANRNRLEEDSQVLSWTDATQTPETGQTTTIEVWEIDGPLITTHDGLTGTSFDIPDASFGSAPFVELRVYSERSDADGDFASLQYFSHWLNVGATFRLTEAGETRMTESGTARVLED